MIKEDKINDVLSKFDFNWVVPELNQMTFVGICGQKGNGKGSAGDAIQAYLTKNKINSSIFNFADELKEVCLSKYGGDRSWWFGSLEQKESKHLELGLTYLNEKTPISARSIMEVEGEKIVSSDPLFLLKSWHNRVIDQYRYDPNSVVIAPDIRRDSEAACIKYLGGTVLETVNLNNSSQYERTERVANCEMPVNRILIDRVIDTDNIELTKMAAVGYYKEYMEKKSNSFYMANARITGNS